MRQTKFYVLIIQLLCLFFQTVPEPWEVEEGSESFSDLAQVINYDS